MVTSATMTQPDDKQKSMSTMRLKMENQFAKSYGNGGFYRKTLTAANDEQWDLRTSSALDEQRTAARIYSPLSLQEKNVAADQMSDRKSGAGGAESNKVSPSPKANKKCDSSFIRKLHKRMKKSSIPLSTGHRQQESAKQEQIVQDSETQLTKMKVLEPTQAT